MNPRHPTAWMLQCRLDSPLGPMRAVRTAQGLAGLWFDGQRHHPGPSDLPERPDDPLFLDLAGQLGRYWTGAPSSFHLPLDPQGTPFQQTVWLALASIARGRTTGYGELASAIGRPSAARAVGAAVGRNPVSIVIPCHRVLGKDGSLTGYAGGIERKSHLLTLEGVNVTRAAS